MSLLLQIVLCLAVATLTVFLVRLFIQARRTAAAIERLADSATRDLERVAEDIHEVRNRLDEVTGMLRTTFELPSALTQVVTGIVRSMPLFFGGRSASSNWIDSLLTGIKSAFHLFRRSKASVPKEAPHE